MKARQNHILKKLKNEVVGSFTMLDLVKEKYLILNISVYVYVHVCYYKSICLY